MKKIIWLLISRWLSRYWQTSFILGWAVRFNTFFFFFSPLKNEKRMCRDFYGAGPSKKSCKFTIYFVAAELNRWAFLSLVYSQHQKCNVRVSLFKSCSFFSCPFWASWQVKLVGVWCMNILKNTQQQLHSNGATSRCVEISPHIGPLCIFTSTQPHSTPLKFILRRGPLKGCVAPFVSAVPLIKIAA